MGGCFTKEEEINPSLSGLNDSRHVMMRRSSVKKNEPVAPLDGSAYKPRQEHKLMKDLEIAFNADDGDDDELTTVDDEKESEKKKDSK